jgi:acylphosphatase
LKRIHIIITGTVTGVGFRWWLKMEAEKRNIHGFVKNRAENEVEALLIGHENDVEDVVRLCRKGPSSSNVVNIKIEDYKQEYFKKSFDIL